MSQTKRPPTECRAGTATRWLVVLAIALLVAGIWRIDGVMGAMGLAGLVWIALSRWLGAANLKRIAIQTEGPARVTAGIPFPLRMTLWNTRRWLDARRIEIRTTLPGDAPVEFQCAWLAAGSEADYDSRATAITRAEGREIRVSLTSTHPFGLFRFRREITMPYAVLVLPRTRAPRDSPCDGVMLDGTPLAGATTGNEGGDLRGLREWRAGDSPRQIAWPATIRSIARGASLVVRESDPPGFLPHRCLVVLHSYASRRTLVRPERFERALEIAGGWIEQLHAMGIRTRVIADFDEWTARSTATRSEIIQCRERFARATRCKSTEAHELQQAITATALDDETLILISDMPAGSWRDHLPPRPAAPRIVDL